MIKKVNMKKILGLDIGTTSIGWAIVEVKDKKNVTEKTGEVPETDINNERIGILKNGVGVRIIAQDTERFDRGETLNDPKGNTLTPASTRRKYRGSRKVKGRYKLRRSKLLSVLDAAGMKPEGSYIFYIENEGSKGKWIPDNSSQGDLYTKHKKFNLTGDGKKQRTKRTEDIGKELYELRDKALKQPIKPQQLGRILLHLNQKRGYSSDRFKKDEKEGNKKGENEFFTSMVENVSLGGFLPGDSKYHFFIVSFENGDKGCEIRKVQEAQSSFVKGEMQTYYFDEKNKEKEIDGIKKIKWSKLDTESFAYRKKQINNKIELFIKEEEEISKELGTVGSFFFKNFYCSQNNTDSKLEQIRNHTIDRDWYENELIKIINAQYWLNKPFFETLNIELLVKAAFKDYQAILSDVLKRPGIKEQLIYLLKDKIIFFQRPWQQAKNKGQCRFEKILVKKEVAEKGTGKKKTVEEYAGRTVIPRSHPLFQEFKIWQQINNVKLFYNDENGQVDLLENKDSFLEHTGKTIPEVKQKLYNSLQSAKTATWRNFVKEELGIETFDDIEEKKVKRRNAKRGVDTNTGETASSYYSVNFRKRKRDGSYEDLKLKGNTTICGILNILSDATIEWLLKQHETKKELTNLQLLWEIIYDITNGDASKVASILKRHFSFLDDSVYNRLANLKFDDSGMASLSAKAIRHLLPLMSDGKNLTIKTIGKIKSLVELNKSEEENKTDDKLQYLKDLMPDKKARKKLSAFTEKSQFMYMNYWEAAAVAYGSHSANPIHATGTIRKVKQHSMNNPVVEKIVNETIGLVNDIYAIHRFDEVRIELSRELKASMEERQQMWEAMTEGAKRNEWAKQMLREINEVGLNTETSNKANLDKIKIIEDVVKYKYSEEYKLKTKEYKLSEPTKADVKKYLHWLQQNFRCPYTNQPIPFTDVFSKIKRVEVEHIIPKERYYLNSYANKVITWAEVNAAKADNGNRTAYEFIVSKRSPVDEIKLYDGRVVRLVAKEDWESHVKAMFPKGGKQNNLLRKSIPDDPIERTLKETQYINKKLKEKLAELVGSQNVWVTSGAVTDILRDKWHLNDRIFKELVRARFENFNIGEKKDKLNLTFWTKQFNKKTNQEEDVEMFAGYNKRIDHRHHAMDAIIVACTKQNHIQYINTLNAINTADKENDESKKAKYQFIKSDVCVGNSSSKFKTPWDEDKFIPEVKEALENLIISHKNTRLLISPSKHRNNKITDGAKLASIRGQLHKDTNYASRKYFDGEKMDIKKLVPYILNAKKENSLQTMVRFKTFEQVIRQTVLKEKYQDVLIPVFTEYESNFLTPKNCKEISKSILAKIEAENLLTDSKSGNSLTWLSVYSDKDKSNRPNGHQMDLNSEKEVNAIINPRLRRLASYRLAFVDKQKEEIDRLDIDKKEKDKLKRNAESLKLYSNAIYEVRVKNDEGSFTWKEIKNISEKDLTNISYPDKETTEAVKNKIKEVGLEKLKVEYLTNPIFISETPIIVKKARQKSWFQDLYEVTPGRFVYSLDVFMVYFFKEKNDNILTAKRQVKFLKFIDAVSIINNDKPDKIDYIKLIEKERTNEEMQSEKRFNLLFTLSKNDLVYLPNTELTQEQIEAIDWNKKPSILPYLYIVKDMNPSQKLIVFQHLYKSDSITINETDAKKMFNDSNLKELTEEIKYGTVPMLQRCIKVFADKLGRKIVPFWEFPNGRWDNQKAIELGLIANNKSQ